MTKEEKKLIPYRAMLKPNGMVEVYNVFGEELTEFNGPWSKNLQDELQRANGFIHLEGFQNIDSRMRGVDLKKNNGVENGKI